MFLVTRAFVDVIHCLRADDAAPNLVFRAFCSHNRGLSVFDHFLGMCLLLSETQSNGPSCHAEGVRARMMKHVRLF